MGDKERGREGRLSFEEVFGSSQRDGSWVLYDYLEHTKNESHSFKSKVE